jgi:hypothetical protein
MMPLQAEFAAERLTHLALSLAFDAGLCNVVLDRCVYLLTGDENYDQERVEASLARRTPAELDIALLRAAADVIEALEGARADGQQDGVA